MNRDDLVRLIQQEVLTTEDAAEALAVSRQRFHQLVKDGKIEPVRRAGATSLFLRWDVNRLILGPEVPATWDVEIPYYVPGLKLEDIDCSQGHKAMRFYRKGLAKTANKRNYLVLYAQCPICREVRTVGVQLSVMASPGNQAIHMIRQHNISRFDPFDLAAEEQARPPHLHQGKGDVQS